MGRFNGKTTVRDKSQENNLRIAETEIDIVAVSRNMEEYLIGECKFKGKAFSYSEYLDVLAKLTPQKEYSKFYYALFAEAGFDDKIFETAKRDDSLRLYSLHDIVVCNKGK